MKNDRDIYRKKDNYNEHNEISLIECFKDENDTTFSPGNILKKYNSLNKAKIKGQNNNKWNDFYNNIFNINTNQYFNNSCTFIMSPKHSKTNYNFNKDENLNIKTNSKQSIICNKDPILNLMDQEFETSLYKQKEENLFELSNQSKDYKNTSINFNKTKINLKKNSFNKYNINNNSNKNEVKRMQN